MIKKLKSDRIKFNLYSFISTFARSLIEIFISLYLFKQGFSLKYIVLFYILENFFAIFLSYIYVKIGEKYKYSIVMIIGIISFITLQLVLNKVYINISYIFLISILYSLYRRGYWVSRRFYITNIISQRNSTESYSIIMIFSELASILSGYLGALILDNFDIRILTIISSILLFISVIFVIKIKYKKSTTKIELIKNIKKYDKRNFLAFSIYELNNLITFLFPIYVFLYINNTYTMLGATNAISNIAIIIFIFIYGKFIKKKNHFVLSTYLFIFAALSKLFISNYLILIIYFFEGIIQKMQNQSLNKIYFENRRGMDTTHYNLIYQEIESLIRVLAAIPLLLINNIKLMILFVILIILIELIIYRKMKKNQKLN